MNQNHLTEAQLFRSALRRWPWFTIGLTAAQFLGFALVEFNSKDVAFALNLANTDLKKEFAFDLLNPFGTLGLKALTSLFVHSDDVHLFSNLPWFIMFSFLLERRRPLSFMAYLLVSGHFASLLGAALAMNFFDAPQWVLGASGATLAFAGTYLFSQTPKLATPLALFLVLSFALNGKEAFTGHLPPLVFGALNGLALKFWGQIPTSGPWLKKA